MTPALPNFMLLPTSKKSSISAAVAVITPVTLTPPGETLNFSVVSNV